MRAVGVMVGVEVNVGNAAAVCVDAALAVCAITGRSHLDPA